MLRLGTLFSLAKKQKPAFLAVPIPILTTFPVPKILLHNKIDKRKHLRLGTWLCVKPRVCVCVLTVASRGPLPVKFAMSTSFDKLPAPRLQLRTSNVTCPSVLSGAWWLHCIPSDSDLKAVAQKGKDCPVDLHRATLESRVSLSVRNSS